MAWGNPRTYNTVIRKETAVTRPIDRLRAAMKENGINGYLMCSTDPHGSEYVCDHYKVTEFISGCTSDNVLLLVTAEEAYLWTDSRYHISAAGELRGTGITLMKEGLPGIKTAEEFLSELISGENAFVLACDGRLVRPARLMKLKKVAEKAGISFRTDCDLVSGIWQDRPALPAEPVTVLPGRLTGSSAKEKCAAVREELLRNGRHHVVLTALGEVMWLTNLRGSDIAFNPVALSYAIITKDTAEVFLQPAAVTEEAASYLAENEIALRDYADFDAARAALPKDPGPAFDPVPLMKACNDPVEIEHIRKGYLLDSVAVCRFLYEMSCRAADGFAGAPFTEWDAAQRMDALRAELPGFRGLSFGTIAAYGPNAAMAHYAPSENGSARIRPEGFLLVDSGGQYDGATTDVTRTVAVGPLTEEMKRDFTLVAAGNLRLLFSIFKKGTTGEQLDMLAREPLYRYGLDFGHGTGHGIGYMLSVHEGPQRIAPHRPGSGSGIPFAVGMVTSDEPGLYREGQYGIRTESILLTVPYADTEDGSFLQMEPLTFAPIDKAAIDPTYLDSGDVDRLNAYHALVFEKVAPYLGEAESEWLMEATAPLEI